MNCHEQVKSAILNIKDELSRISAVAELFGLEQSGEKANILPKITEEFNRKLRVFKQEKKALIVENRSLKNRIKELESQLKALAKPSEAFSTNPPPLAVRLSPPKTSTKRQRSYYDEHTREPLSPGKENDVEISLSPIKQDNSQKATITSSQFNGLATQYSDALSPSAPSKKPRISPRRETESIKHSDHVEDSQDEFGSIEAAGAIRLTQLPQRKSKSHLYPSHYTALQRVEFLRAYYEMKLEERGYKIDLTTNPITEKNWALDDFVPNKDWIPPKQLNPKLGVMTNAQEKTYAEFFGQAGYGVSAKGPAWDSDDDLLAHDGEWVRSQVMNKYLSPPGYMTGDFLNSQDAAVQKGNVQRKERERVVRRMASALAGEEFVFYEDVFNNFARARRISKTILDVASVSRK